MLKAIEDVQELHPDPKHATTHNMNLHAGGSHKFNGKDPADRKKQAIRDAVSRKLKSYETPGQKMEYPED